MPFCKQCGLELDAADVACPDCGTPNVATYATNVGAHADTADRASFGLRFGASIIDGVITAIVSWILAAVLSDVGSLVGVVAGIGYYVYFHGSPSGQTVGKRAVGIRVVTENGGPLGNAVAAGRYFATILSAIPCGLGYLWMLWDPQKQTWHDKLAHTYVVTTAAHPVASWPG